MAERRVIDLRPLGIPEVPMLGRYRYRHARRALERHAHRDVLEICYLATGQQLYRVGRRDYVLTGGDLFVTFPGEEHSTGVSPEEKAVLYWVQFRLPRPGARFLSCGPREARALVQALLRLPHRHFAGEPALARTLDELLAACQAGRSPLRRLTIHNQLVGFLLRVLACASHPPRVSVSPRVSELLRYIEANLEQTLPLPALAARTGLSLPRFKARFKAEVGIPPAAYVLRCKIAAAKQRLVQPNANVTRIAHELNFSSSQYFATVFRRYTNQTPRQFRAQARR